MKGSQFAQTTAMVAPSNRWEKSREEGETTLHDLLHKVFPNELVARSMGGKVTFQPVGS